MKKVAKLLIFTLIIVFGTSVSAMAEDNLNVGLYYGSNALSSVALDGPVEFAGGPAFSDIVVTVEQPAVFYTSADIVDVNANSPIFVTNEGAYALYVDQVPDGSVQRVISSPALRVQENGVLRAIVDIPQGVSFYDSSDNVLSLESREYRGWLVLRPSNNAITVINHLDYDSYLCGVLPYEMSSGWPIEALKAQAVAARNYVINNLGKHQSDGFDLCNTTHCQVYRGKTGEANDCTQAVLETAGTYLYYNGTPAQTFYFSSSGGRTENVKDVWGSSFPYLVSVEDTYEKTADIPSANWKYTISGSALSEKMSAYSLGTVTDVSILSTTDGGRAKVLKIVGSLGNTEMKATDFRSLLGVSSIKGTYFTVEKSGGEQVSVLSAFGESSIDPKTYAISSNGEITSQTPSVFVGQQGTVVFSPSYKNFEFVGKGYGHGVGMSQWGARGMAEAGFTYDRILTHYFTGTELRTEE